jgi:epoxyqueuosine reductase
MDDADFAARFARTAVARTGRARLARNAAIALGNAGVAATLPAVQRAADGDPDPVVREAAAWAAGRIRSGAAPGDQPG